MTYNFIIADDHCIVRQGISFIINEIYDKSIIYQAATFLDIIKYLKLEKTDLLILDINFPEGSSLNIIATLKKIQPDLKILIFSAYKEDIYAIRYLNAGANGFLNKLSSEDEIKEAIISMISTGKFISQNIQTQIMDSYILKKPTNPIEQLSNREIEIAKLLVEGYSNIDICKTLSLQKTTVSTYKSRIFEKLNVSSLSDLINIFNLYYQV